MKTAIARLEAKIDECCSRIDAADKVALGTAKRLDRLEARLREARRALRHELELMKLRAAELRAEWDKARGDR